MNLAIQIFDRTYISSNQDFLLINAYQNSVKLKKSFVWLTGGAREMDIDKVLDVLDVALSSDEEDEEAAALKRNRNKKDEVEAISEDMI